MYEFPASLVNELMSCAWIEAGCEIESVNKKKQGFENIRQKIAELEAKPKPKFNF
jgi:hypothetical protein